MRRTGILAICLLVLLFIAGILHAAIGAGRLQAGWDARFAAVALVVGAIVGTLAMLYASGALRANAGRSPLDTALAALSFTGPVPAALKQLCGLDHPVFLLAGITCFAWTALTAVFLWRRGTVRWTGVEEPAFPLTIMAGIAGSVMTGINAFS
jgi:hypothetical protein